VIAFFTFSSFFLLKNKCLFIEEINLDKINFAKPENVVVMNVECGNVIIELYPNLSPQSVKRFKTLIKKKKI
jgi:hypothetical protein